MQISGDESNSLEEILVSAVELLHARRAGVYLLNPITRDLTIKLDTFSGQTVVGMTLRAGEGMAGELIASGAPWLCTDDYGSWSGRMEQFANAHFEAVIEIPLRYQETPLGVLYVEDTRGRRFSDADGHLLLKFAKISAIALAHSQALAEERKTERKLSLLLDANNAVVREKTPADSLQGLAKLLVSHLSISYCQILLLDECKTSLVVKAAAFDSKDTALQFWTPEIGRVVRLTDWGASLRDWKVVGTADVDRRWAL